MKGIKKIEFVVDGVTITWSDDTTSSGMGLFAIEIRNKVEDMLEAAINEMRGIKDSPAVQPSEGSK